MSLLTLLRNIGVLTAHRWLWRHILTGPQVVEALEALYVCPAVGVINPQ